MKNKLLFPIIFAFIFSACSDFSGNEDAVEASLKPAPVTETTTTTIKYSKLNGVTFGNNTFVAVGDKGAVRTSSDNGATWDNGTSGITSELNEIAYGNSTFVAVGQSGRIYTSSDNGTTWSRSTWSGSDHLTGVAYGNNIFNAVSSANVIKSTDNGSNWILKSSAVKVYDVGFGNDTASGEIATVDTITHGGDHDNGTYTSVALSGGSGSGAQATVIVSGNGVTSVSITDGGTALYQIGEVLTIDNATIGGDDNATCRVATVTVTSNVFIGVGAKGASCYSPDDSPYSNGEKWICNPPITNEKTLYGITYGNNKFITVGASGSVLRSDDGSDWDSSTSNTTANLYSVAFGNSRFVAVGYKTVIVSDNGTSFTRTASYDFNDISFGNGIFVAVGDDENIHTSTDGDDWKKVYGK
jgi:hypothetical protein